MDLRLRRRRCSHPLANHEYVELDDGSLVRHLLDVVNLTAHDRAVDSKAGLRGFQTVRPCCVGEVREGDLERFLDRGRPSASGLALTVTV
ncbi:hypothetical protein ID871_32615 [Streptomyces pratensis]|nr:hypothetical protein [Streptomyces pratensis]